LKYHMTLREGVCSNPEYRHTGGGVKSSYNFDSG